MLDLIGLIIANQSSLQQKVTMQEKYLCSPPTFIFGPAVPLSHFFILESPLGLHISSLQFAFTGVCCLNRRFRLNAVVLNWGS